MFHKNIDEVKNPIISIFLALAVSSICYGLIDKERGLSICIVAFFFVWIFCKYGIKFTGIILVFFIVGLLINSSYYNISNEIDGVVRINEVSSYNVICTYKGKKIIISEKNNNLVIGERYKVKGKIEKKPDKSKGIVGEIKKIQYIDKVKDDFISNLYKMKRDIHTELEKNLGSRKAGLICSISFGDSQYLDSEDKEDMKNFGIIHSISVSGLHVVIVFGILKLFFGNKYGLLFTIIYVIFTGASYSSIRAFVMLSAIELAHIVQRNNNSISSLCLSGLILTIYKPYSIFEISFHLSYLATLGIILLNKKINDLLYKLPTKLREGLSICISAQVFTLPYLMLVFKEFSINFIFGNLLLIPFINILVIIGNLTALVYKISWLFDYMSYLILYIIKIFDWVLNKMEGYSLPLLYGNEYIVFFYLFYLISVYFVKKGYKEFIYLPIAALIVMAIQLYSPFLTINYYTEGAIVLSYKGDRIALSNKGQINLDKTLGSGNAEKVYRDFKTIKIDDSYKINSKGKDYELAIGNKKYLLKMSTSKNESKDYDIINFKEGLVSKILIIDSKIIRVF